MWGKLDSVIFGSTSGENCLIDIKTVQYWKRLIIVC